MIHLRRAIGNLPLLAVSTDAYDGLENAVKDVFPHAEQRECFCNTPGVTVAVTVYLLWPLQYIYNICYSANLIQGRWFSVFENWII
jgi:hypothetical protein